MSARSFRTSSNFQTFKPQIQNRSLENAAFGSPILATVHLTKCAFIKLCHTVMHCETTMYYLKTQLYNTTDSMIHFMICDLFFLRRSFVCVPSFVPSFLPSFFPSFLLPSFLLSLVLWFLRSFVPSFLRSAKAPSSFSERRTKEGTNEAHARVRGSRRGCPCVELFREGPTDTHLIL